VEQGEQGASGNEHLCVLPRGCCSKKWAWHSYEYPFVYLGMPDG